MAVDRRVLLQQLTFPEARTIEVPDPIRTGQILKVELPPGHKLLVPTEGLGPGDKLHEGLLFRIFTNDQHWALIHVCGIADALSHWKLVETMSAVVEGYTYFAPMYRENGPYAQHRDRLLEIGKLCKRLAPLLREEPFLMELVSTIIKAKSFPAWSEGSVMVAELIAEVIPHIGERAGEMGADEARLRSLRADPRKARSNETLKSETLKSVERCEIWEPILRLWTDLGLRLGYSENGPIIRAIRVFHEALGIEAPKAEAIRQVIRDCKREYGVGGSGNLN